MLLPRLSFLTFLFACLLSASALAGVQKPVPLFLQENLDAQGRQMPADPKLMDILAYFERKTGLRFAPVILPWKRAQAETLRAEGIIYGFSRSVERLQKYDFSESVISEGVWAITYGDPKPALKSVDDLRGKVVGIGRGFSHGLEFDQARDRIFTVQEDSASTAARFKKLLAGRSDLMMWPVRQYDTSRDVENYINQVVIGDTHDAELMHRHFDVSDRPLFFDTVHFAAAKGQYQTVLRKIDQAILRGRKDGSLARVLRDYH